jgi:hypothetical protein
MTRPYESDGCETVAYQNPLGEIVTFRMAVGGSGRMMPPVKLSTMALPARNGSRFLGSAHAERAVAIPVVAPGVLTDRAELRRWARVLDPNKGEGTLTVIAGPSPGRYLRCAYDAGLDSMLEDSGDLNAATLLFRAAYPYWLDAAEQTRAVTQGASVTTWFPFLPLVLGASDAFAAFTITIAGDVESWPIVTVLGPGQQIVARNLTTGYSWTVTTTLAAGSTLTVDTRPGKKQVSIDGTNAYSLLAPSSSLWPLVPGANRVELAIALTSPASVGTFAWRNAWLAA